MGRQQTWRTIENPMQDFGILASLRLSTGCRLEILAGQCFSHSRLSPGDIIDRDMQNAQSRHMQHTSQGTAPESGFLGLKEPCTMHGCISVTAADPARSILTHFATRSNAAAVDTVRMSTIGTQSLAANRKHRRSLESNDVGRGSFGMPPKANVWLRN